MVPAYHWHELPYYGTGLKLYDLLAGRLRLGMVALDLSEPRFRSGFPRFAASGLHGGIVYTDGQFDDSRLAITLARTLADLGGTVLNYAAVTNFTRRDGRIAGVIARDVETGVELTIRGPGRDQRDRGVRRSPCGSLMTPAPRRS